MKSEAEIRAKLTYYQCLLAGFRAGAHIDRAGIFLALEQLFPRRHYQVSACALTWRRQLQSCRLKTRDGLRRLLQIISEIYRGS